MQFNINVQLKKDIQKKMMLSRKSVRITYVIEKIFLTALIVSPILFFVINVIDPTAYVGNVRGEIRKNYGVLILLTTVMASALLGLWISFWTLRTRLSSLHTSDRVDEAIEIIDTKLIYTFRIKYQSNPDERNIVVIDLESLEKVDYEIETKKLIISGKMIESIININEPDANVDMSNSESREIIIYDYFEPSLVQYIKNNFGV